MIPDNIRCARERAYFYGADWVILAKEASRLAPDPLPDDLDDCSDDQLRAVLLLGQALAARARYFRELVTIDALTGNLPSPFAGLG